MKIIYRKCENDKISRADALLIFYRNLTRIHCEICQISYNKFMFCIQSGVKWILVEKSEKL